MKYCCKQSSIVDVFFLFLKKCSEEGAGNSASPGNTPPAIGSTVTLSKGPTPSPVPTPVPSVRPPIRSGTITIKAADAATVSTTASSVEVEKLEVRGKGGPTSAGKSLDGMQMLFFCLRFLCCRRVIQGKSSLVIQRPSHLDIKILIHICLSFISILEKKHTCLYVHIISLRASYRISL